MSTKKAQNYLDTLNRVIDLCSENFCDKCGKSIFIGTVYYAKVDDAQILCADCVATEMLKEYEEDFSPISNLK